jgi:hypothetical protein
VGGGCGGVGVGVGGDLRVDDVDHDCIVRQGRSAGSQGNRARIRRRLLVETLPAR